MTAGHAACAATDFGSPLGREAAAGRDSEGGRSLRGLRPPRSFKEVKGIPSNVRFGGTARIARGHTAAQRNGLAYEVRVLDVLAAIYGIDFRPAPSILFTDRTGNRMAIPDGILKINNTLVVVEIKLSHTERAWWQLTRLYSPLLARLVNPGTRIATVEICRSYDPSVQFPGPSTLVRSLHRLPLAATGILHWKI